MSISIAHLGPPGTYAEQAALAYIQLCNQQQRPLPLQLSPGSTIARTIQSTAQGNTQLTIAPVENAIEGSVTITQDLLWQLPQLEVRQALILPIIHVLASHAPSIQNLKTIYSHPQALGQCQKWLEAHAPQARLIATNSTTEAVQYSHEHPNCGAISSQAAAQLYNLPILQTGIQDHPHNCTRFWLLGQKNNTELPDIISSQKTYTSLAFSLPKNRPGALLKPLEIFALRNINLSRIESRPSKRSMGDYVFFIDAEITSDSSTLQDALNILQAHTEVLRIFGSYPLITVSG